MHAPSALKLPKTPTRFPEDPKFKGPGFDFNAKGQLGTIAAIVIIILMLVVPRYF